jgi:hypothetical protein
MSNANVDVLITSKNISCHHFLFFSIFYTANLSHAVQKALVKLKENNDKRLLSEGNCRLY